MNTATYRNMARNAASAGDWSAAAKFFDKAVAVYPGGCSPKAGTLADRDIAALRDQARACRSMGLTPPDLTGSST